METQDFYSAMWAVVHRNGMIQVSTLDYYRKGAIKKFAGDSAKNWSYWKRSKGFSCQKLFVRITANP